MALSAPAPRAPIHNRTIVCEGFRREDGLWDIEGRLIDTKAYAFPNMWRGEIQPGDALHEMLVRLTIDNDYTVVALESATDNSPHQTCGAVIPNFQKIVGQKIGPGWTKRVKALIGGVTGCVHQVELICILGTVAFQTVGPALAREGKSASPFKNRSFLVNSCHIWAENGEWAKRFATDPSTLGGAIAER